jgi:hypothetical protein
VCRLPALGVGKLGEPEKAERMAIAKSLSETRQGPRPDSVLSFLQRYGRVE